MGVGEDGGGWNITVLHSGIIILKTIAVSMTDERMY